MTPAPTPHSKIIEISKLIIAIIVWAGGWLLLHSISVTSLLPSLSIAWAYILSFMISVILTALFQIAFLAGVIRVEGVRDMRRFFKIERIDVRGIWLTFSLGLALQIANSLFLWRWVLQPAQNFLIERGLGGSAIGLGTGNTLPAMSPLQAVLFTIFLLVFWWLEVPEEMFFRGYLQNRLQSIVGISTAMLLSAFIWDICHLWGLTTIVERFLYGLIYAGVFRARQNTTSTMIPHPLGNRALVLGFVVPQIISMAPSALGPWIWALVLAINVGLLLAVIGGWRMLKLDQPESESHL